MIDTHCHLTDPRLESQLEDVVARAAAAGVVRMITISTDVADAQRVVEMSGRLPNVRCAVGIHPNHAHEADMSQIPLLRGLQEDPAVVAMGEMGLDYHYGTDTRGRQRQVFELQMQIAREVGRVAIIHCREAVDDTLAVMRGFAGVPAIFHCFTGTIDEARRILDAGYWLGFTGVVTFKKSNELREVVRLCPLDRLLIETDAPYLSPEPVRKQKVNEPALVVHVAATVAQVKQMRVDEVDRLTTDNTLRFFRWT